MEIVFKEFRDRYLSLFKGLGDRFSDFIALKTGLKTKGIFVRGLDAKTEKR